MNTKRLVVLNSVLITLLWVGMTINRYSLHTTKLRVAELDSTLDRTQQADQELINSILHKMQATADYLLEERN